LCTKHNEKIQGKISRKKAIIAKTFTYKHMDD
jgi:hypothetical protein